MRPELLAWLQERYPGMRFRGLAGDASTRRFWRIFVPESQTHVVMDYGAPFAGRSDDERLSEIFLEAGLPVAAIRVAGPEVGALVLEDLGDRTFESAVGGGRGPAAEVEALYRAAVDLAIAIADRGTLALRRSDRAAGPALDAERFRFEMDYFVEHYVLGFRGRREVGPAARAALHEIADLAAASPRVLCHRDFHSRNLMVRRDGTLAMVDLQDARWGPDTYDLASLLFDAYSDLEEAIVVEGSERYRAGLASPPEPGAFRARLDVVAVQRMIKALGTFGYQIHRMGRERYRDAVPRTVARLARLLPKAPVPPALPRELARLGLLEA